MMADNREKVNVLWLVDHLGYDGVMHGASKYYLNTIPDFDQKKFTITLCVLRKKDHLTQRFENAGINVFHLGRGKFDPMTFIDVLNLARNKNIQIIHAHGYGSSNFGRLVKIFRKVGMIVHAHDDDRNYPFHQKFADHILNKFVDNGIAISEFVKESLVNKRGFREDKVFVLHNGIPLQDYAFIEEDRIQKERKSLGIHSNCKVVGTVARLREEKGVKYLIQSAVKVFEVFPETTFLIAGDGPLREELIRLSIQLGMEKNIIFPGFCQDIPAVLSILDIVVVPSITEGLGIAIMEAMAMGKSIVATNVGGIREILKDGETGLLVPPKDPLALAEKTIYLFNNKKEAQRLGVRAKEEIKKFDNKLHVRKLEEHYYKLITSIH